MDMQLRGVLQPLVVHPADTEDRYRIHFGAKRLRAAIRVGLSELPVVIRDVPADRYAQVVENQKRRGLTPLEPERFIQQCKMWRHRAAPARLRRALSCRT